MTSGDPTPRLFAATAALTGTGLLMCRTEPSWDGILIGLLCLGLWALGTFMARSAPAPRPTRPILLKAVIVETPRATQALLPAPRPAGSPPAPVPASRLSVIPTHRQRVAERHTRRSR